jgi:hypothetical protein
MRDWLSLNISCAQPNEENSSVTNLSFLFGSVRERAAGESWVPVLHGVRMLVQPGVRELRQQRRLRYVVRHLQRNRLVERQGSD